VKILTEERLVVCGLVAATQMTWGSVVPVLPQFADRFGVGAAVLGMIVAAFGIGRLVVNIPAGLLAPRVPTWPVLLSLVVGVMLCTLATGLATDLVLVLVLRVVAGLFAGAAITLGQTLVLEGAAPGERGRVSSFLQGIQLAGGAVGPALGGIALSLAGVFPAFVAASTGCVVFVVWALLRYGRLREASSRHRRPDFPAPRGSRRLGTDAVTVGRRGQVLLAVGSLSLVGMVVFAVRFGGQQSLVPLLSVTLVGVEAWQLGLGLGAVTVVSLALLPVVGAAADRGGRQWLLGCSLASSAALTPLYLATDDPLLFLGVLVVVGVTGSLAGGLPLAMIASVVDRRRLGAATGVYRTFGDLGTITGPLLLTALLDARGATTAVWCLAGLTAAGAVAAAVGSWALPRRSARDALREGDVVGPEVPRADLEGPAVGEEDPSVLEQHRAADLDVEHLGDPPVGAHGARA